MHMNKKKEIVSNVNLYREDFDKNEKDIFKFIEDLDLDIKINLVPKIIIKNSKETIDAIVKKESEKKFQIYINKEQHNKIERLRFTLAHEIAHIYLGHFDKIKINFLFRDTLHVINDNDDEIESEANIFAAELLMPEEEIRTIINDYSDKVKLVNFISKKYKVTRAAAIFRLDTINTMKGIL